MAGKRCGERFGKDRRNESDLVAAGDNAESWSSVFTAWLVLLIIAMGVGGSMACEADQVKVGTQMNHTCVPCVECPHGMEPSIACGGHGLVLECTPCKPGTFSSAFDKHECRPCTICDDKLVVLQNCTSQSNSKCGGCRRGYYRHNLIPDCLPCSPCCEDGQDVHPPECKTLKGMQCEKRHSDCPPAGFHSPVAPGTTVTPVSPTSTPDTFTTQPRPGKQLVNPDTLQATIISVVTTLLVVAVVIVTVYKRRRNLSCLRAQSRDEEGGGKSACAAEKELGVPQPLRELKTVSLEAYERTYKRLDKKLSGTGHFENVAIAFFVKEENIFEFEKELRRESGSPSQKLLEYLAATKPELTVPDFIKVLQRPEVRREDIVKVLKPFMFQSNSHSIK